MTKKKLTIADLIDNKERLSTSKNETKNIHIEKLDAVITIVKPARTLIFESLEMGSYGGDEFLVYNSIIEPNLKDKELQSAYGCVEPTDIVNEIFDMGTVKGIAEQALSMVGVDSKVKAVDDLKN